MIKNEHIHAHSHLCHCLTSTSRFPYLRQHWQLRWRLQIGDYEVQILIYLHPYYQKHQAILSISLALEFLNLYEPDFFQKETPLKMKQSKSNGISATCNYNFNIL